MGRHVYQRSDVKCRERYTNVLKPIMDAFVPWSEDSDQLLQQLYVIFFIFYFKFFFFASVASYKKKYFFFLCMFPSIDKKKHCLLKHMCVYT